MNWQQNPNIQAQNNAQYYQNQQNMQNQYKVQNTQNRNMIPINTRGNNINAYIQNTTANIGPHGQQLNQANQMMH